MIGLHVVGVKRWPIYFVRIDFTVFQLAGSDVTRLAFATKT